MGNEVGVPLWMPAGVGYGYAAALRRHRDGGARLYQLALVEGPDENWYANPHRLLFSIMNCRK